MKEKMFDEEKVKTLLSLLEYLKKYLPFDLNNLVNDIEVYAFIRLFQNLGGITLNINGFISIPESFEIALRYLNGERVVLKEKKKQKPKNVICASPYILHTREHIAAGLTSAALSTKTANSIGVDVKTGFDKPGFTKNPKTKMKLGNKIPKQNKRRR